MKTVRTLIGIIVIIFLVYFISCEIVNTSNNCNLNSDNFEIECHEYTCEWSPDHCFIPSYCNNGKGNHICLYLKYPNKTPFPLKDIEKMRIDHTGTDCNGNDYYCSYITEGSDDGCVLPWCTENCAYTRSVCLKTKSGETYTGSAYFSCPITEQVDVYMYYQPGEECDWGSIQ